MSKHIGKCYQLSRIVRYPLNFTVEASEVAGLETYMLTHVDVTACTVSGSDVDCTQTGTSQDADIWAHIYVKFPDLT